MPVYNCKEALLRRCIESVVNQTIDDGYELILVDDGSTNNSGKICDEYVVHKNVRVIHKSNGGVASARNAGIKSSKGTYIAFIDNDDYIRSDAAYLMMKSLKNRACDIVYYDTNKVYSDGRIVRTHSLPYGEKKDLNSDELKYLFLDQLCHGYKSRVTDHGFHSVWFKAFRKSFLESNNIRFDESIIIGDDDLFNIDCCIQQRNGIMYDPIDLYERYINAKSESHRYHQSIKENDKKLIAHIQKSVLKIDTSSLNVGKEEIERALCKRYVICALGVIKYDMAHNNNPKPLKVRTCELRKLSQAKPYAGALINCDLN